MKTSILNSILAIGILALLTISCSKDEESGIRNLFIEAEKDLIILGFDDIKLNSIARDQDLKIVEGINVIFSVNGAPISGNTFVPEVVGEYEIVGMYQGIESNTIFVTVTTIQDDLDRFELYYNGNQYLTTNSWSVSGIFRFNAVLGVQNIDIPFQEVQLLVDGNEMNENEFIHFDEPGTYRVTALFSGKESNPILLFVREEKQYDEITIPVIFHTYGVDYPVSEYSRILDSLNSAFSRNAYDLTAVQEGLVNPNAVDCRIKFYAVRGRLYGIRKTT